LLALQEWSPELRHAEETLSIAAESVANEAERALAQQLFYGVIRQLALLDFLIDSMIARTLDPPARNALRLGLFQLLFTRIPSHAAVHETVSRSGRAKPIVNAVLRRALREQETLSASLEQAPPWTRLSHPQPLFERWRQALGEPAAIALCEWNNRIPDLFVRLNGLRATAADLAPLLDRPEPVPEWPGMFKVRQLPKKALAGGLCYVQDPSTLMACDLLAPTPGDRVLDLCAAPGGKTAALAERMGDRGEIIACDSNPERLGRLESNMDRMGIRCVKPTRWNPLHEAEPTPEGQFDRILVDAPCSNSGVARRRVDVRWRLRDDEWARMATLQTALLRRALPLLRPGGALVYSTCSIEPEENEAVSHRTEFSETGYKLVAERTIFPPRDGFDGAYAARFERIS
jgi:16S rRNA (cytosine967-C5)-methyltransferase